jgi:hypothetical protein
VVQGWVFVNIPADHGQIMIPGFLEFRRSLNDGAVFDRSLVNRRVYRRLLFTLGFVFHLFANGTRRQQFAHRPGVNSPAIGNLRPGVHQGRRVLS